MARSKRVPLQRQPSDFSAAPPNPDEGWKTGAVNGTIPLEKRQTKSYTTNSSPQEMLADAIPTEQAGLTHLLICVGGIYASFLSWALLQERISTTSYGPASSPEQFTYSVFLNTIQSTFAALTGYAYLLLSQPRGTPAPSIFPTRQILFPLILVAITSSLASPFGYASLAHIDYITFILAKSCKLLPVMFLHLTIFRKSYPVYKFLVVALVTAGVAVFTVYHPSSSSRKTKSTVATSSTWGLFLLSINLLFDGLTNSTQDHIFSTHRPYSGPQMMVAQNFLSTVLTVAYLLLCPLLPSSVSFSTTATVITASASSELPSALSFISRNPSVLPDLLAFSACGAIGQIFIYYTLSHFSSLLLVTVTVTRKMLTMMLSVMWFGHRLSRMQWVGVGLVFGGVGAEGWIQRREKQKKKDGGKKKEKEG